MIGTRLGPYEITAKLGEGGMGEVWRARDTKLERDVAIKVLPAAFVEDHERLARFEREAKLLAQLNHPNIAHIYGMETSGEVHALVMELVEGSTLAERLESGALPLSESLSLARQIAEALEEAHEKGIVHRDLKPQNIKASIEGKVKVLDFGLAKAMSGESGITSASALANSPTLTAGATVDGMILGTAAYMSPEQAKGRPVDKRADIWAFGVVLYEMLLGRKLFEAETLAETLGAIFRQEIDLDELPASTPRRLRRLLERCLERDPKRRLRDIGEARIALDAIAAGEEGPAAASGSAVRRGVSFPIFAIALAGIALAAGLLGWRAAAPALRPIPSAVTEFSISVENLAGVELSGDGKVLAWRTRDRDGGSTVWARTLDDRQPKAVMSGPDVDSGFLSPDGSEGAFVEGGKLWTTRSAGGDRRPVCDLPQLAGVPDRGIVGAAWLADDTILFAAWRGGIYRVPARGGKAELYIPIDPETEVDFRAIVPLPDGKSLILLLYRRDDAPGENPADHPPFRLQLYREGRRSDLSGGEELRMLPVGYADGTLALADITNKEPALWGAPFDPANGKITGKATLLVSGISMGAAVGADGTLVYVASKERPAVAARVDLAGKQIATLGQPQPRMIRAVLSPDGSRLALVLDMNELWINDLARGTLSRLVRETYRIEDPQWSRDGRAIYYANANGTEFRRVRADPGASAETVADDALRAFVAPDGSGLVLLQGSSWNAPAQGLYWAPFDADGRLGERTKLIEDLTAYGRLGPNGKLLAYGRSVDGRREAFLTTFPKLDQTIQLSSNGGGTPQWSADGRSVFYLSGNAMVEVEVGVGPGGRLAASPEHKLFALEENGLRSEGWTVAPDGNGLLFIKSVAGDDRSEIVVVRNGLQRALAKTH